jgi:very-short-patch-repair endonuclease
VRIFNKKYLKQKRKDLKNKPTRAEAFLWGYLKGSKFEGKKFRRQTSIKSFIVDFYCPEENLVVELDGEPHFEEEKIKYDKERTKKLEELGLKVIRFQNQDVLYNLDDVLEKINKAFKPK